MRELPLIDIRACCAQGLSEPVDRDTAARLAATLKAVADPARLQLLALIRNAGEAAADGRPRVALRPGVRARPLSRPGPWVRDQLSCAARA